MRDNPSPKALHEIPRARRFTLLRDYCILTWDGSDTQNACAAAATP